MPDFGKFFLPGPTEVRPEILDAMARPVIGHRGVEMKALMGRLTPGLQRLFRTRRPVYVSTSSATGLMEAAIRNCVARRALCLVCGSFGERFYRIARSAGREADRLDADPGEANEPEAVSEALRRGDYDAVTVVHSETSTGVLSPVGAIADAIRAESADTLIIVDCVSSLAAAPVESDEWGLDFALTGSQKALALPPGLAFGVASERALERARGMADAGLYFAFEAFERAAAERQTTNTPAVSLLYALEQQLDRIEAEGLETRWARHHAMAERAWGWVSEIRARTGLDFHVLAREDRRSPTVTCVVLPEGLSGPAIVKAVATRGFTLGSGYGPLKERTFRIGHMGDHTLAELDALLENIEQVIIEQIE